MEQISRRYRNQLASRIGQTNQEACVWAEETRSHCQQTAESPEAGYSVVSGCSMFSKSCVLAVVFSRGV